MKRPRTLDAWWNGGPRVPRTAEPTTPAPMAHKDLARPEQFQSIAPTVSKDPGLDQARAVESFGDFQIQHGTELLTENKPIETAADLQNINAALELNPTLAKPEPEASEPMHTDPMQPGPMPIDPLGPKPVPGG